MSAARVRRLDRAAWLMSRELEELGSDLREARLGAGLTLREVGARVGMAASVVLATERGRQPGPRPALLARHAAAVGMRARIKAYPDGEPLRDAASVALLAAFRQRLAPDVPFRAEQPVTSDASDQRAFDALLMLPPGCRSAVEVISRFHDCQAQLRQLHLKQRDGEVERMILVIKATQHNRRALATAAEVVGATFPLGTRRVMAALAAGRDPGGNGVALL
jgi:transcriptional regulator with XRE-family HTH domain